MSADRDPFLADPDLDFTPPDMLVVTEDEGGGEVHDPNDELTPDQRIAMLVRALVLELAPTIVEALGTLAEDEEEDSP